MRIMVIGTGYVGLVSGVCFAEFGFKVLCVDNNINKIEKLQQGISPIFEPSLDRLLQNNIAQRNIEFTTILDKNLEQVDLILLAVGTPSTDQGEVDLSYILQVAIEIAPHLHKYTPIVVKSTVPPGTCRKLKHEILNVNRDAKFDIISNPEFLREGLAVQDFMQPDRVVIGLDNPSSRDVMAKLYKPLQAQHVPIGYTTLETAEMIKYAANALLATKVAFINEIADLCEKTNADIQVLAHAIGLDKRIGPHFLQAGPGFGGSCFPKDTKALQSFAKSVGVKPQIVDAVIRSNDERTNKCIEKILAACNGNIDGKEVAVLGVAFKANTDDIRESPALSIICGLQKLSANLRLYDPKALQNARDFFGVTNNVRYANTSDECLRGANVAVILTEWDEFKNLKHMQIAKLMSQAVDIPKVLIDLRNLFNPLDFAGTSIEYVSIGRPVHFANVVQVDTHDL